jgi:hemoglobin-like flavoprotein
LDKKTLDTFDASLKRCIAADGFLTLFYEKFLSSSPKVREKFASTDFDRQRRALQASLHMMLLAAQDGEERLEHHLGFLARRHSRGQLDIGPELYDLWLESLLATIGECDLEYGAEVENAWRDVMGVGIRYMLDHYDDPPSQ